MQVVEDKIKKELVDQIIFLLNKKNISQNELARRMNTDRCVIQRLLDPDDNSLTLKTLLKLKVALNCEIKIIVEDKDGYKQ